jgi:hypothetical protein
VFASGSTQFWLNAFSDNPEVTGGFDNGVVNQVTRTASYIVRSDEPVDRDGKISVLWLKAMGVQAVVVGGADTRQAYRDDQNPGKFEGVLERVWHEGGDSIYRVPQRSASLARVMTRADLADRTPANGIDIEPLVPYVKALDDAGYAEADFRWTSRRSAAIQAKMSGRQVVSVQVSFHPGWHARVNGVEKAVMEDGLGQMYVEPGCEGDCSIELNYDGGVEMSIARGVAAIAWVAALGVFAISFRSRADVGRQR